MNFDLQLKNWKEKHFLKRTRLYLSTKRKSIALERLKQEFHFEKNSTFVRRPSISSYHTIEFQKSGGYDEVQMYNFFRNVSLVLFLQLRLTSFSAEVMSGSFKNLFLRYKSWTIYVRFSQFFPYYLLWSVKETQYGPRSSDRFFLIVVILVLDVNFVVEQVVFFWSWVILIVFLIEKKEGGITGCALYVNSVWAYQSFLSNRVLVWAFWAFFLIFYEMEMDLKINYVESQHSLGISKLLRSMAICTTTTSLIPRRILVLTVHFLVHAYLLRTSYHLGYHENKEW
jgi:hypothetical protein